MATCEQTVSSEAEYDYNCTPCMQRERITEAKKFCVECGEYFCSTCLSCHEHFGATKGHTLVDCHEVTIGHVVTGGLNKCKIHENKEEDMVCGEHDVVCCRVCISINHRACKGIDYLPQAAQTFKEGKEQSELGSEVKSKIEQLKTSYREHTTRAVQLKMRERTLLKRLHQFKETMTELIENLVTEAETDIGNSYEPEVCSTQEHIKYTDKLLSKLNALSDDLENENDPVILYKKALECKHILRETQILQSVVPHQKELTEKNKALTRIVETIENSMEDERLFGAIKIADQDTLCNTPSMCLLPDGSFCLARYQMRKIVHIDKRFKDIDTVATDNSVWGICAINKSRVAFTMPTLKTVQFLSYERNPVLKDSFHLSIECRSIAYFNEKLYVACGGFAGEEPGQLHILDLKGNLLRKCEQDSVGKYFSIPRSVFINSECIFVTDHQNGVICLDLSGERKWVHRNPKCKFPWGICFTANGNLLISGRDSNNIVVVSKDCEYLGELLTENDGLSEPMSLMNDIPNGRLLVSGYKSNVLRMFEFDDCRI